MITAVAWYDIICLGDYQNYCDLAHACNAYSRYIIAGVMFPSFLAFCPQFKVQTMSARYAINNSNCLFVEILVQRFLYLRRRFHSRLRLGECTGRWRHWAIVLTCCPTMLTVKRFATCITIGGSRQSTLALKPIRHVTRNPKHWYQWPQNRICECVPQEHLKKKEKTEKESFHIHKLF